MLERKAIHVLEQWDREKRKSALCLLGARQTGKTTLVEQYAKENYECFLKLDFIDSTQARRIFETAANTDEILLGIEAYSPSKLIPGKTLILLDEIQECPQARTAVKYLVQDGRYRYIETGSLLGVKIKDIRSLPVGFEELVSIYPLDFEEFLWATGIQKHVIEQLKICYEQQQPVPEAVHEQLIRLFYLYSVIGGMPEVVQNFVDHKNSLDAYQVQRKIISLYRADISQYAEAKDRLKVQDLYNSVPYQLNEKNMRFFLTEINPNARLNRYESSLVWLIESETVLPSYSVTQPQIPLLLNAKKNLFRLFMNDCGLLCAMTGRDLADKVFMSDYSIDLGALFENVFAQLLCAQGYSLYYYNSKKHGEVDFVVERDHQAVLIEIKSGKSWQAHPALSKLKKIPEWADQPAIVFCQSRGETIDGIRYLPWYMVMFFHAESAEGKTLDFNFENLSFPMN